MPGRIISVTSLWPSHDSDACLAVKAERDAAGCHLNTWVLQQVEQADVSLIKVVRIFITKTLEKTDM